MAPFSRLQVLLPTTTMTLFCLCSSAAFFNFLCLCLTAPYQPSHLLSTTFCLLSMTPLNPKTQLPVSGHLSHFPFFFGSLYRSLSLSFCYVSFILSSSLSYIIQASASHSEIKACACVPSNSKLPTYWKDRQVFVHGL